MGYAEQVAPDEKERFEGYARELQALRQRRDEGQKARRTLHLKTHVGVVGKLVVGAVPADLQIGPFSKPSTWPLYARFSSGSPGRQSDGARDVRGLGLKLVGVPGAKIIPGLTDATTQDFLFINTPVTPVRGPDEFMDIVRANSGGKAMALPRLIGALGLGGTVKVIKYLTGMPQGSLGALRYFTAVPLRFGDNAAKLTLTPEPANGDRKPAGSLREDLVARLGKGALGWRLTAQRFVDERTTPIEDASVEWTDAASPPVELGRVELSRQDVGSTRGAEIETVVEALSFDPWHALEALRPLGAMMRARGPAYREAVLARSAAPEPQSVLSPGA